MKILNNSSKIEIISQKCSYNALYQSKEEGEDQKLVQSITTPNGKVIKHKKTSHIGEARDHPFPIR